MRGKGRADQGCVHFFFDITGSIPRDQVRAVNLLWRGDLFEGNDVKMYSGPAANGTWRINLKGKHAPTGRALTQFAKKEFVNKVLVFLQTGPDTYLLEVL